MKNQQEEKKSSFFFAYGSPLFVLCATLANRLVNEDFGSLGNKTPLTSEQVKYINTKEDRDLISKIKKDNNNILGWFIFSVIVFFTIVTLYEEYDKKLQRGGFKTAEEMKIESENAGQKAVKKFRYEMELEKQKKIK